MENLLKSTKTLFFVPIFFLLSTYKRGWTEDFHHPSLEFLLTRKEMLTYFATDFTGGGNRRIMGPVNVNGPGATETLRPRAKTVRKESL
jgi:hypothetical protein